MKTKEFIEMLQKEDPEGTAEVVVGGTPIYYAERLPGYYDGHYSILIQDKNIKDYYNVLGIKHTRAGDKLVLKTLNTEDILDDNPEAIVELCPSLGEFRLEEMKKGIEEMRQESRKVIAEVQKWHKERDKT